MRFTFTLQNDSEPYKFGNLRGPKTNMRGKHASASFSGTIRFSQCTSSGNNATADHFIDNVSIALKGVNRKRR